MGFKSKDFREPGKGYRAVSFWSWNDDLQRRQLAEQIEEMAEQGWGGFFMHSRVGLVIPYLSSKWMECIKTCVREAKKRGMKTWLYDEDKWPSGFAGGRVPGHNPAFRAKALICKVDNRLQKSPEAIAYFAGKLNGNKIEDLEEITDFTKEGGANRVFLHFLEWTAPIGDQWFNGFSYIDTLNPKAVHAFVEFTHESYYRELGDEFGETVPGIFTDEPCYLYLYSTPKPAIPWTTDFPRYFKEKNGYDLIHHLPSLFYEAGNFPKVRYDYWSTVTDLFIESYSKQIYEWCEAHNLQLTGHYMGEDTLLSQIQWIGAAMPHYQYMHLPGVDHLGYNIDGLITIKQVDSVVCQLGKQRCLCETYGGSGQALSFEDRKWIGNWLYVLGVNLLTPHLALYSMRGCRKRDYPPNLFYQQPWWKYNRLIEDHFARLSYILTQGVRVANILVVHPITSAWVLYSPNTSYYVDNLHRSFVKLCRTLLTLHRDYHFGDEKLMKQYAYIQGGRLYVGKMGYDVIIVPPSVTLDETTVQLLKKFAQTGGQIIAVRPLPYLINGQATDNDNKVLPEKVKIIDSDKLALKEALDRILPPEIEIKGGESIWYQHRRIEDEDKEIYFLVNTDREHSYSTTVKIHAEGKLEEWHLLTGEITSLYGNSSCNTGMEFDLDFPPAGQHLLILDKQAEFVDGERPRIFKTVERIHLPDAWSYKRQGFNALLLDYCRYRIEREAWSQLVPVWKAHDSIHAAGVGVSFSLRYTFEIASKPKGEMFLVLETPERFKVLVNDREVTSPDVGHWWDVSFRKLKITSLVRSGNNTIELQGTLQYDTELEHCYIVGNFAVKGRDRFLIAAEEEVLHYGDLVRQGYPFFAGTIIMCQRVKISAIYDRVFLKLNAPKAIVVDVWINDHKAGQILWPPYSLEITDFVHQGNNKIELGLVNSLRNLLGPHHVKDELLMVTPQSFCDESNWTDAYKFTAYGIEGVELICQKG